MYKIIKITYAPILCLSIIIICCTNNGGEDGEEDGEASNGNKATRTCTNYKDSFCTYSVECGILPRTEAECVDFLDSLSCNTERLADDCRDALDSADCTDPPSRCDVLNVLDRSEAIEACQYDQHVSCTTMDEDCDYGYELCMAQMDSVLPCEFAVKLARDPQPCFDVLESVGCDDDLPEVCRALYITM